MARLDGPEQRPVGRRNARIALTIAAVALALIAFVLVSGKAQRQISSPSPSGESRGPPPSQ